MFILGKLKQFLKKKYFPANFCILVLFVLSCGRSNDKGGEKGTTNQPVVTDTAAEGAFKDSVADDPQIDYDLLVDEYEDPERRIWQNPDLVLEKLGNTENKVVADIGAGTGYFTFPLAAVSQKVIAIDIQPTFLDYIEDLKLDYPRDISDVIETRLSVENDPMLQEGEVDAVLMVNVYSYLNNRVEYLKKVRKGLSANGVILIVDFKKGNIPVGPEEELKVEETEVSAELKAAGFRIVETDAGSLQYQYLIKAIRG